MAIKKTEGSGAGKKRTVDAVAATKGHCGTLSYLAECRGATHKAGPARRPQALVNTLVRTYSTGN